MTAYNRGRFIAEAIESVLASTFNDFELIIVDDASTDGTVEIARQYLTDPRVQVYVNEKNLGDYPNRNKAASYARGRYLKYLDSDDVIYPHGLEVMVQTMTQFPEAALGICRVQPVFPADIYPMLLQPRKAYYDHFFGKGSLTGAAPTKCIIQAEAFRAKGGFSGKRFVGDTEMWLRLTAEYPVVKILGNLVWCRPHSGQEYQEGLASLAYPLFNYHMFTDALKNQACPLSEKDREKAILSVKHQRARLILKLALIEHRFNDAFYLYRDSGLSLRELARGLKLPKDRLMLQR